MRPKIEFIGSLPDDDPLNQQVRRCFTEAGFTDIRLELNADRSMLSFLLKRGTHAVFRNRKQAHAAILRLLLDAGLELNPQDLAVWVDGDAIDGAFTPYPPPEYPA